MRRLSTGISLVFAATPLVGLTLIPQLFARPAPQSPIPAAPSAEFERTVRPFLVKNCVTCHSDAERAGGLTLEQFKTVGSVGQNPTVWQNVIHKMRAGLMPPPGSPRPAASQVKTITGWLETELARADAAIKPEAGRVTAHRLNRAEYNNTVRDLLGVDFHPADDFPQDDSGYGFDNIGDVLSLSPPLLEKYLGAAEKVARTALFGPAKMKPSMVELRMPRREFPPDATVPKEYDETGLTLTKAAHAIYRFPEDGSYAIRATLTGTRPAGCEPMQLALWVDGNKVAEVSHDPEKTASFAGMGQPPDLSGQTVSFPRVRIPAGDHWIAVTQLRMYEGLPATYGGPNPSKRPVPKPRVPRFFQPPPDATPEEIAQFNARIATFLKRQQEQVKYLPNAYRVGALSIGGPYDVETKPSAVSQALIYTCGHQDGHHTPECAQKIVSNLMRRAFRRPVTAAEVAPYIRLVNEVQKQGDSFEEGLCVAIQGILVSPHFLYRVEQDPAPAKVANVKAMAGGAVTHPISPYELASRLSYFLWSSMPDEELLRSAENGSLEKPEALEHQVRRMLQSPKAHAFTENFAGQWLELRKLEYLKPNLDHFLRFDDYLRLSMRQETEHYFDYIVKQDRPITEFLDSDYTFVNERLARYYDIPGVVGTGFRKVSLAGTGRGGVLTQASVLTVSSYATRTSPVLRGKWILENILNTPPPPPPPDIPKLDETKIAAGASLRVQLEQHRKNALCASCHSRMDPLGFALENFDAVGEMRFLEGAKPIDATGKLPDGRTFDGPAGLKKVLLSDKGAFTRALTEKMLTYALGRGLEPFDRPTVKAIAARVAKNDYRFSSLVLGIVESLPFQQRKGTTL